MTQPVIRRAFCDLADGQIHYRHAGEAKPGANPLVMIHPSPGSSRQLAGLMAEMAHYGLVIAPDTRGNGDSTPLLLEQPEIADFARATLAFLDAMGIEKADLWGAHTGACIAMELALIAPDRVGRLVIDGVGLYSADDREELLSVYAPHIRPDLNGSHLNWAFMFCRDQYVFWPWFKRDGAHLRNVGLPDAETLNAFVLEVLKSVSTYHLAYRAAFRYVRRDRLPHLTVPTMAVCSREDMPFPCLEEVISLVPGNRGAIIPDPATPSGAAGAAEIIAGFYAGG